jgi:manganese/zinc/iron transport system substrate-binding protein
MVKLIRTYFLFTILFLALSACQPLSAQAEGDLASRKIRAVATTGMIGDIVQNVGGERVQVSTLMGAGVDPHLYKASEGDVIDLGLADVIFYNGLHLEAGMARVLERIADQRVSVAVTDPIDRSTLFSPPQFQGNYDPHVWFDVAMWMEATEQVRQTLIAIDPTHAALYQQNSEAYLEQLKALDACVLAQAQRVPPEKRVLITAHDAFNYFGRAYGFEVRGLQGISTATEAGTLDVQDLAEFIVERQIPAIFVESSVPRRTIEAVQAAVRARGYDVQVGGQLYSDAMGSAGTPDSTYIGMVRHNIDTIVNALLADIP